MPAHLFTLNNTESRLSTANTGLWELLQQGQEARPQPTGTPGWVFSRYTLTSAHQKTLTCVWVEGWGGGVFRHQVSLNFSDKKKQNSNFSTVNLRASPTFTGASIHPLTPPPTTQIELLFYPWHWGVWYMLDRSQSRAGDRQAKQNWERSSFIAEEWVCMRACTCVCVHTLTWIWT